MIRRTHMQLQTKIQKIQHSTEQLHMDPQRQQHRLHHQMEDS